MFVFFFFFKQKTAYEMRISDWSSDVCSSDLDQHHRGLSLQEPCAWRSAERHLVQQVVYFSCGLPMMPGSVHSIGIPLSSSGDRKSVVSGKSVSVRVDLGGRRIIQKKYISQDHTSRK